jgi:hypothetical protein
VRPQNRNVNAPQRKDTDEKGIEGNGWRLILVDLAFVEIKGGNDILLVIKLLIGRFDAPGFSHEGIVIVGRTVEVGWIVHIPYSVLG